MRARGAVAIAGASCLEFFGFFGEKLIRKLNAKNK